MQSGSPKVRVPPVKPMPIRKDVVPIETAAREEAKRRKGYASTQLTKGLDLGSPTLGSQTVLG